LRRFKEQRIREIINSLRETPIFELKGPLKRDTISLLSAENEKLFNLRLDYSKYLKDGRIDEFLKKAFDEKNESLSTNAHVLKIDNKKWEIKDGINQYVIEDTGTQLEISYKKFDASLLGVLDYRAYYNLEEKQLRELNFVFIDIKNATLKADICRYLYEKKIMSFNLASDMDILSIILSSRDSLNQFKKDIIEKYGTDLEIHVYRALKPLYLEKIKVGKGSPDISDLNLDTFILSKIQRDYSDQTLTDIYRSLLAGKVLIGHGVLYDFIRLGEMRDFALLFNINEVNESLFYKFSEFSTHIIDLYKLDYDTPPGRGAEESDYTSFYSTADYLAFLEFSSPDQRFIWEKMLGTIFHGSNAFFFPISTPIFSGPYGASDVEFNIRCNSYSREDGSVIYIGNAVRNGLESSDKKVGLELNSVNGNGVILGESQTGKSTTMIKLIEGFIGKKLTVHLVNPTKDTIEKLQKVFGDKVVLNSVSDLKKCENGFNDFHNKINIFSIDNKEKSYEADDIIKAIKAMPLLTPISKSKKTGEIETNRQINHVLMIDEAHDFFIGGKSGENLKQFADILEKISHYGIALYLITQKLSHLQIDRKKSLVTFLQNRIIHQMLATEAEEVAKLLAKDGIDSMYRLDNVIPNLQQGHVFISFIDQYRKPMPPLKIHIFRELEGE
jgi:hypothetical protein